jgi:hypothetical protein
MFDNLNLDENQRTLLIKEIQNSYTSNISSNPTKKLEFENRMN